MYPAFRKLALFLLASAFLCAQDTQQPTAVPPIPPDAQAPAQQPTTPDTTPPDRQIHLEGPSPTQIIGHEHSVTDMLDVVPFKSEVFHNTRMLRIFLPANYFSPHNKLRKYPVLYLQDGQNVFDKATSFSGREWQADETIDHLVSEFKIPPMFIVGIDNAGEQRASEYLTYPDAHNPQFQNAADAPELEGLKYETFLIKEVMPFLEKRYRIAIGPAYTALGGSSYGATVSLTTALHHPGVFGKLLLESPALWVGDGKLLTDVEKAKLLPQKIYLGIGTRETDDVDNNALIMQYFRGLEQILKSKGMGPSRLEVFVEEGGQHNEDAWARRLPEALLFLYGH